MDSYVELSLGRKDKTGTEMQALGPTETKETAVQAQGTLDWTECGPGRAHRSPLGPKVGSNWCLKLIPMGLTLAETR